MSVIQDLIAESRDGRFFHARVIEQRGDARVCHSGVMDLDSGQFTFACDVGVQIVLR